MNYPRFKVHDEINGSDGLTRTILYIGKKEYFYRRSDGVESSISIERADMVWEKTTKILNISFDKFKDSWDSHCSLCGYEKSHNSDLFRLICKELGL